MSSSMGGLTDRVPFGHTEPVGVPRPNASSVRCADYVDPGPARDGGVSVIASHLVHEAIRGSKIAHAPMHTVRIIGPHCRTAGTCIFAMRAPRPRPEAVTAVHGHCAFAVADAESGADIPSASGARCPRRRSNRVGGRRRRES